ncbi:MAG: hypothetical protein Q9209_001413 [Squamulea sp. 1 TL-2023]
MPPNTSLPASNPSPSFSTTSYANPSGDSPLSTTANVLSILTFALGLFASYVALISATRGAPAEIKRLVDDLRTTQKEINRFAEYIYDDMHYSNPGDGVGNKQEQIQARCIRRETGVETGYAKTGIGATTSLAAVLAPSLIVPGLDASRNQIKQSSANEVLYEEVQGLLKTCVRLFYEADDLLKRSERDPYGLRRRILFVMNRDEVTEKMNRLADQKAKLAAVQMSLFMRYVSKIGGL